MQSVLIVDDNPHIRAGLRKLLEDDAELRVCDEAADGLEAVRKAGEQRPALILMDLSMPKLNGVIAAARIRELLPDTRIVVFTLFSDSFGKSMTHFVGADLVISKTDGINGLMKELRKFLSVPRPNEKPLH